MGKGPFPRCDCGCGPCSTTICVSLCSCSAANTGGGVTVTIKSGSTVVATGVTASNGCVVLDIGSAGTYTVINSIPGYPDITHASQALTCGGTKTYSESGLTNSQCCNCCPISKFNLNLTDSLGTYSLTWSSTQGGICAAPSGSVPGWCPGALTAPVGSAWHVTLGPPVGTCLASVSLLAQYTYMMECIGGNSIKVTRVWLYTCCSAGFQSVCPTGTPNYKDPGSTGSSDTGSANLTLSFPSTNAQCNPFSWTGTLATQGSPLMPDPVGGTVSIS